VSTARRAVANSIESLARELGAHVESYQASTGTIYLSVSRHGREVKIRVANHGDCYETADLSLDPQGLSLAQVRAALPRLLGVRPGALARLRRARRGAARRHALNLLRRRIAGLGLDAVRAEIGWLASSPSWRPLGRRGIERVLAEAEAEARS
jgi:hypothetical protein